MKQLLLLFTTLLLFSAVSAQKDTTDFVTTWRTVESITLNSSNDSSVHINIDTTRVYNYDVDWDNDGVFDNLGVTAPITHQYPDTGTYTIRIRGQFPRIFFGGDVYYNNVRRFPIIRDFRKLVSIDQWGNTAWEELYFAFSGCGNMQYNATDVPNLTRGPRLGGMFSGCGIFNGFIGNWDVSRVKIMNELFEGCRRFNQDLSAWQVDSVTDMNRMFSFCSEFNQNISTWNMSQVVNLEEMFYRAYDFNQDISSWDVSSVTTMEGMFEQDSAFNQDISSWQVDSVENFSSMFKNAVSFNQDISSWSVDSAFDMRSMFEGATTFNKYLGNWDLTTKFKHLEHMLDSTDISRQTYDSLLIALNNRLTSKVATPIFLGAAGLEFCTGDSAYTNLRRNWFFTRQDIYNCLGVGINKELTTVEEAYLSIYPNPTNGIFTIEYSSNKSQKQELLIYNMQGSLVYSNTITSSKQVVDLSAFKSGIYLARLGNETKRVVVM